MTPKEQDDVLEAVERYLEERLPKMVQEIVQNSLEAIMEAVFDKKIGRITKKFWITAIAVIVTGVSGFFGFLYTQNMAINAAMNKAIHAQESTDDINSNGTVYGRRKSEDYTRQMTHMDKNVQRIMDHFNITPVPKD